MADLTYQPFVYRTQGSTGYVVASGGRILIETGGGIRTTSITALDGDGNIIGATITANGLFTGSSAATVAAGLTVSSALAVTAASTFSAGLTVAGVTYGQGGFKEYIQTMTSSAGIVNSFGLSIVKGTTATPIVHTVVPVPGIRKSIVCPMASGTTSGTIVTTTGTWDGANKNAIFSTGNTNPQWLQAIAGTTDRWYVVTNSTDVTFTNT
jgi:hypothetical protein